VSPTVLKYSPQGTDKDPNEGVSGTTKILHSNELQNTKTGFRIAFPHAYGGAHVSSTERDRQTDRQTDRQLFRS